MISFVIWGLICCTGKKTPDCEKLKNGKFHIISVLEGKRWEIQRMGDLQHEYDTANHITTYFKVTWESDCEYHLKKLKKEFNPVSAEAVIKSTDEISNDPPFKFRITDVQNQFYLFEFTREGFDGVLRDTMWIDGLVGGFKSMGSRSN
jgi:hypothetical protein